MTCAWSPTRPATLTPSLLYSQNTKYGFNLADFDTFFDRMEPDKRNRWLPSALARRWAAAFGAENVRIRALDPDVLTGGSLESDFLSSSVCRGPWVHRSLTTAATTRLRRGRPWSR